MSAAAYQDFVVEIVRKRLDQQGFQVLLRRWVVERAPAPQDRPPMTILKRALRRCDCSGEGEVQAESAVEPTGPRQPSLRQGPPPQPRS